MKQVYIFGLLAVVVLLVFYFSILILEVETVKVTNVGFNVTGIGNKNVIFDWKL